MTAKSWFRLGLVVLGVLFILGSAVVFALRVHWRNDLRRAVRQFEEEVGPLDPRQAAPPSLAPGENAASWLIAAGSALLLEDDESETMTLARVPLDEWTPEQVEAVRALLAAHPEPLTLAARAVPLDGSNYGARYAPEPVPVGSEWLGAPKPVPDPVVDMLPQMSLASYLRLSTGIAIRDGDCAAAVDRMEVSARHARAMLEERMVLFSMLGSSFSGTLLDSVEDSLKVCQVDGLQRALILLRRVDAEAEPAHEVLRGEAASSLAQMSLILAREQHLPMRLFGDAAYGVRAGLMDRWRDMVVATRDGGVPELRAWSERWAERVEDPKSMADIIAAILMPNLVDSAGRLQLGASARRLAMAALALRIEGLRTGRYPSLSTLEAASREPTPYLHETVVSTVLPDGSVELTLPKTAADFDATHPEHIRRPTLSWSLPPLSRSP